MAISWGHGMASLVSSPGLGVTVFVGVTVMVIFAGYEIVRVRLIVTTFLTDLVPRSV